MSGKVCGVRYITNLLVVNYKVMYPPAPPGIKPLKPINCTKKEITLL